MAEVKLGRVYSKVSKRGKAVWMMDFSFNGRRIRKICQGALTEQEAVEALKREYIRLLSESSGNQTAKREGITFRKFSEIYLNDYSKVNNRSHLANVSRMKTLNKFFGSLTLYEITPAHIEKFKSLRLRQGVSKSTIDRELALLKRMFSVAIDWNYASENPVKKVKLFKPDNKRERVLTPEEETRLLAVAKDDLRMFLILLLNTGLRKMEALSLKWTDVDFEKKVLFVRAENSKSGRGRVIPLNSILLSELKAWRARTLNSPYVFPSPENPQKHRVEIKIAFKNACKKAGISNLMVHDLRGTFATKLLQSGTDVETTRAILGHHSIVITQRYCHTTLERMKQAVETLGFWHQKSGGIHKEASEKDLRQ